MDKDRKINILLIGGTVVSVILFIYIFVAYVLN